MPFTKEQLDYAALDYAAKIASLKLSWGSFHDGFGMTDAEKVQTALSDQLNNVIHKAYVDAMLYGTGHWKVNPKYNPGDIVKTQKSVYESLFAGYGEAVKPVKKDYQTVGVRFLQGPNLQKVYTYKVRKGAKLRLGQEIVVPTQREVLSNNIAVVVELHKTPQDKGPYDYKFVAGTVTFL